MTDPIIMVVENDAEWLDELGLMYSRILRGQSNHEGPSRDIHPNVHLFPTALAAISFVKRKPEDRSNAKSKVNILSLDVNLERASGGTGLTVLRKAVENGNKFVTIGISGLAEDDDLKSQLSDREYDSIQAFEAWITSKTKCKSFYYPKKDLNRRSIKQQVRDIELNLLSKAQNGNILRQLAEELRAPSAADLNGKSICLHFRLPNLLFGPTDPCLNLGQSAKLSTLKVWKDMFDDADLNKETSALLTRVIFLADPGRNHKSRHGMHKQHPFFVGLSVQTDPASPLPVEEWLTEREGAKLLSEGELRDLLWLMAKDWSKISTEEYPWQGLAIQSYDAAMASEASKEEELIITGLKNQSLKQQQSASPSALPTVKLPYWLGARNVKYTNGDNLQLRLGIDQQSDQTAKTRISRLRKALHDLIGYGNIELIVESNKTYNLAVPGQVFIHRGD